MEDDSENDIIVPSQYNLPEAPKALVNEIDPTQIPSAPPFKVHLRNLHYELEKEDLEGLFRNLTIVDIQMIKDRTVRTAWIEFETKQDLIQALDFNNRSVRGRNISMSLDRGGSDRYGDRRGGRGGFGGRDNTSSDWRSRDSMPPKQVYPPPSVDSYDHAPRTGYSGGSNRGPRRYGDDDYQQQSSHRNDYGGGGGGGGGGYDDRGDDRSGYDDRYGRRNDYGHRRGGGGGGSDWRRNDNR
ncbi:RNA-binding domain containing protein, partial [Euroglyphus maynei]